LQNNVKRRARKYFKGADCLKFVIIALKFVIKSYNDKVLLYRQNQTLPR